MYTVLSLSPATDPPSNELTEPHRGEGLWDGCHQVSRDRDSRSHGPLAGEWTTHWSYWSTLLHQTRRGDTQDHRPTSGRHRTVHVCRQQLRRCRTDRLQPRRTRYWTHVSSTDWLWSINNMYEFPSENAENALKWQKTDNYKKPSVMPSVTVGHWVQTCSI